MDSEWKERWIKALRSGDYKQGRQFLRTDTGFCCLGVLCDISRKGEWGPRGVKSAYPYVLDGKEESNGLPYTVGEAFRFPDACQDGGDPGVEAIFGTIPGLLTRDGYRVTVAELNDAWFTFDQIADVIDHFL